MPGETSVREQRAVEAPAGRASTRTRLLVALAVIALVFAGWETLTSFVAYTADAYVRSDLVAFSPQVTGHVVAVHVQDNQAVRRGDLLLSIDPVPFQLAVEARKANLAAGLPMRTSNASRVCS